jgi:hypothetical protein
LSVIKFSTLSAFVDNGLDVGVLLASSRGLLPLNALAGTLRGLSIGVIIIYAVDVCSLWVVLLLTIHLVG